jgi:hypothetical protein
MHVVVQGGLMQLWSVPDDVDKEIRKRLTFSRRDYQTGNTVKVTAFEEREVGGHRVLFVPRHLFTMHPDLDTGTWEYKVAGGGRFPDIRLKLDKVLNWRGVNQEKFIAKLTSGAQEARAGGYGIAPCGCGKTLMGLETARRLGKGTLIILNRTYQVDQWIEEIENSYEGSEGSYGVYQGKRREGDRPIVLGTVMTLMKVRDPEFYSNFGTVIFDEGHHIPARTWLQMLASLRSEYIFALTAGFHRTDGLDKMFRCMLGKTIAEAHMHRYKGGRVAMHYVPPRLETRLPYYGRPLNRMQLASFLSKNYNRTKYIGGLIAEAYRDGRHILVFSDIRKHLESLHECSIGAGVNVIDTGFFVGGMSKKNLDISGKKLVTFVTYEMGRESMNLPWKDAAFCCTPPSSNLKQLKGRVDRVEEGKSKRPPLIADFSDPSPALKKKAKQRVIKWSKEGLAVKYYRQGVT